MKKAEIEKTIKKIYLFPLTICNLPLKSLNLLNIVLEKCERVPSCLLVAAA
jgi:hypothetical protein